MKRPFWAFELGIEPRDLWVGLYWTRKGAFWHFYVCIVPVLVFHFYQTDSYGN